MEVDDISPEEKEQFYKGLEVDTPETRYIKTLLDKKAIFQQSAEKVDLIELICSKKMSEAEMDIVYSLDISSDSGVLTNSMYIYAMTFCLLHEFSHHSLGQDFKRSLFGRRSRCRSISFLVNVLRLRRESKTHRNVWHYLFSCFIIVYKSKINQ